MSNTYQLAAIGPSELISGLKAIGITPFEATDSKTMIGQLNDLRKAEPGYACVYITAGLLQDIPNEILYPKDAKSLPVIITIPDLQSDKNAGLDKLRDLTRRAIGSDLFN